MYSIKLDLLSQGVLMDSFVVNVGHKNEVLLMQCCSLRGVDFHLVFGDFLLIYKQTETPTVIGVP